ncbi:MAG: O-acetyl-ADP-ribose deacetylase (regulator of RNase III) [Pirellulaceae bacterium]|jgi:O-acetyl-ADP-ribose deacetylase (regulator of RNase III)
MEAHIAHSKIELVQGDITDQAVDVVVNAANHLLAGGGGVDGAIHDRGGPTILDETKKKYPNGCETGDVVVTSAGRLQAKYVFHAVGPIYRDGHKEEAVLLAAAYRRSLELAVELDCQSIAFPALSAGAYRYPLSEATEIALDTINEFLLKLDKPLTVRFVLFDSRTMRTFVNMLLRVVAPESRGV